MTDRAKKVTELTALSSASGDDLLLIVDDPGGTPESKKITVANFVGNVVSNAAFKGTMSVNGAVTFSNTVSVNGKLFVTKFTPANSTANGVVGQISFSNDYVYCCISNNVWRRAELFDW